MTDREVDGKFFQDKRMRLVIFITMITAFSFGYMHHFFSNGFERLHIFLFNLTTGGSIILYYTENRRYPSFRVVVFFILSIAYALTAFFEKYIPAVIITVTLSLIVESIRIRAFSFFPFDFFRGKTDVSKKFHQASLLCLSMGLMIASFVILNNEYFKWVHFEKLKLNVFFLGFSFPVSLITMSVMFSFLDRVQSMSGIIMRNIFFWVITLGVISFFIFIIFEMFLAEALIAFTLYVCVMMIFYYYIRYGIPLQQKYFLISGMAFLLSTAITGVLYLLLYLDESLFQGFGKIILSMHAFLSLYGWNLSGLMVIMRWNDFPLSLNTVGVILMHWITIGIIAPLGKQYMIYSILAIILYMVMLVLYFTGKSASERKQDGFKKN